MTNILHYIISTLEFIANLLNLKFVTSLSNNFQENFVVLLTTLNLEFFFFFFKFFFLLIIILFVLSSFFFFYLFVFKMCYKLNSNTLNYFIMLHRSYSFFSKLVDRVIYSFLFIFFYAMFFYLIIYLVYYIYYFCTIYPFYSWVVRDYGKFSIDFFSGVIVFGKLKFTQAGLLYSFWTLIAFIGSQVLFLLLLLDNPRLFFKYILFMAPLTFLCQLFSIWYVMTSDPSSYMVASFIFLIVICLFFLYIFFFDDFYNLYVKYNVYYAKINKKKIALELELIKKKLESEEHLKFKK